MFFFDIFRYEFMQNAFLAGTVVAIVAGIVGYFTVLRGLTFAGHSLSHVGFAGATAAVYFGVSPIFGLLFFTIGAALGMGALGDRIRGRDVAIGIVLSLALGLGVLFLTLYTRYATEAFSILFGTILGVSRGDVLTISIIGLVTLLALAAMYRPLLFASIDPEVAEARGVPVRLLSVLFMVIIAIAVSQAVQVVGVLLIFTLLVAPAATAQALSSRPAVTIGLSVLLALCFTWAGLLAAFNTTYPVSFFISVISFSTYVLARLLGPRLRQRRPRAKKLLAPLLSQPQQ